MEKKYWKSDFISFAAWALGFTYRSKLFIMQNLIFKCFFMLDLKGMEGRVFSDQVPSQLRGNSAQESSASNVWPDFQRVCEPIRSDGCSVLLCVSISKYGLGKPNFNHALLESVGNSLKRLSRPVRLAAADCSE